MKKIISILLVSFFTSNFSLNAQSIADYTIYYDFIFITDTVNNTFSSPEEFVLLRIGQESIFMTNARYYNDSALTAFSRNYSEPDFKSQEELQKYVNLVLEKVPTKAIRSDYRIIKNFETSNITSVRMYSSVPIQYMEETMAFEWDFTEGIDTILGLPCMKANTSYGGRHYYAWFTLDVPINDGPYVFQGLPGLILKVVDDKGWYTFTAKNIITEKKQAVVKEWIDDKSQKIDRKTFVEKMIGYKRNPSMPTGVLNFPEEKRLERKSAFEKRFDLLIEQY